MAVSSLQRGRYSNTVTVSFCQVINNHKSVVIATVFTVRVGAAVLGAALTCQGESSSAPFTVAEGLVGDFTVTTTAADALFGAFFTLVVETFRVTALPLEKDVSLEDLLAEALGLGTAAMALEVAVAGAMVVMVAVFAISGRLDLGALEEDALLLLLAVLRVLFSGTLPVLLLLTVRLDLSELVLAVACLAFSGL